MDMDDSNTATRKNNGSSCGGGSPSWWWTDERHVRFLNSIEASFVRAMFDHNNNASNRRQCHSLRLDRPLPDCFDSTLDVGKDRRRRHSISTSDAAEYSSSVRTDKKSRRLSSHDQVVPQLEGDDDGIKDEKEKEV
ncbi:uncharacterized protein LOC113763262 [Coffea eugenioides]|uniref:Uncharacterized protein n=1 Tax=Coffea arabica TaxID=13443 RepID=A0A6P6W5V1_COFAR|nr:uncharacterized protein LOC113730090 [Coffea arabica]XP_027162805.1 uncharacterized protein LOC113763249 [Coffea eugenioides]XP_027162823.1 uncharacterized protein LOC113763262 [Coffea eugenioides]